MTFDHSIASLDPLLGNPSTAVSEIYSHLQPEHLHGTVNKIAVSMN
jgi:hypothetical protein